jgi:hypothetical protein
VTEFKPGDRVAVKFGLGPDGFALGCRRGTVQTGNTSWTSVVVCMDSTGKTMELHYSMWRHLDLVEQVGDIPLETS